MTPDLSPEAVEQMARDCEFHENHGAYTADTLRALSKQNQSLIWTLEEIADMGKTKGCETARHRLAQLGINQPDYGSMT